MNLTKICEIYEKILLICAYLGLEDYSKCEIISLRKIAQLNTAEMNALFFKSPERVNDYTYGMKMKRRTRVEVARVIRKEIERQGRLLR